jgi:hypothetical protein
VVKVKNFPSRTIADLASDILKKEGIRSWVSSLDVAILGVPGNPVPQGADLYVDEEDAERARELVYALFGDA